MSGRLFDQYGAILNEDVEVLEECLFTVMAESRADHKIKVCEIGMHDGGTAKGIERYIREMDGRLDYFGIDPDPGKTRPRYIPEGGTVIIGDSAEVFDQVPNDLDILWVDGCHCRNHVVLDTFNYEGKVRHGGFMLFHDVNPKGQNEVEHQYHGPNTKEFGLAVVEALKMIRFPWNPWTLFRELSPTEVNNCGTRAYKKG